MPTELPLLAKTTQDSYQGIIAKYLEPRFSALCLRDLTPLTLQRYFSGLAGERVGHPSILKIRDTISSILRSAVQYGFLIQNPMVGLKLPVDKRPRRQKPVISPEQFSNLVEYVSEPYASMLFVSVWTGLRISELIGLKWRCIHADSITVEERYFRGDWSTPKTNASAATIGVSPDVIARIQRLTTLTVEVRAGRAIRSYRVVKSAGPDDLGFSVGQGWKADVGSERSETPHSTGGPPSRAEFCGLALLAPKLRNLAGSIRSRPEIGARSNATLADFNHTRHLRAGGSCDSASGS